MTVEMIPILVVTGTYTSIFKFCLITLHQKSQSHQPIFGSSRVCALLFSFVIPFCSGQMNALAFTKPSGKVHNE